jgi:cytoskeleton protein RodZ
MGWEARGNAVKPMTLDLPTPSGIPSDTADNGPRGQRIGMLLRRTREGRRIAIDDAAATLRLKVSYLEAIERGAYERLPGPAYAVGFVRAYAEYLGLDGNEAARRFKREAQGFDGRPDLSLPMPVAERSIPGGRILVMALVLAVCGYGFWYYVASGERRHPEIVAAVPPSLRTDTMTPSEAKAAVDDQTRQPATGSQTATKPQIATNETATMATSAASGAAPLPKQVAAVDVGPQGGSSPIGIHSTPPGRLYGDVTGHARIELRFSGDCWIQVKGGGPDADLGKLMHAGDVYRVPDHPGLVARVGDSDAVMIVLDGKVVTLPKGNSLVRNINLDPKELAAWAGARAPRLPERSGAAPPAANLPPAPVPASAAVPKAATIPPKLN